MTRCVPRSAEWNRSALLAMFLMSCLQVCSAADEILIVPVEDCTTAFAGEEFKVSLRIIAGEGQPEFSQGTLQWNHAANQRTISRGEVQLDGGLGATADFVLRSPELREGVIFTTTITTNFVPEGKAEAAATLQRTLTLFPKNPLAGRLDWAESLEIELFDPVEDTTQVFEDVKLPFRAVRNVSVGDTVKQEGILMIGEGTSLIKHKSLVENALNAAAGGRRIIMLAPSEGAFVLPGTTDDAQPQPAFPGELRLSGTQVITQLDKRLDATSWVGTGNAIPSNRLRIESRRGRVEAHVSETAPGWPWLEVRFFRDQRRLHAMRIPDHQTLGQRSNTAISAGADIGIVACRTTKVSFNIPAFNPTRRGGHAQSATPFSTNRAKRATYTEIKLTLGE